MLYNERRLLGYSAHNMFKVVSGVEKYAEFIPHCKKATVTKRSGNGKESGMRKICDLEVGFPPFFREFYTSHVYVQEPFLVTSTVKDSALFEKLNSVWTFRPKSPETCMVDFAVEFRFRQRTSLHGIVAKMFFDDVVKENVGAFLGEAAKRFGPESIPAQKPVIYSEK